MPFSQGFSLPSMKRVLSAPRLLAYGRLLNSEDHHDAISAYVWSLNLNAALSPLLGTLEVALRNSIHHAATEHFGRADWLQDVLKWHGDKLFMDRATSDREHSQEYYRSGCHPFHRRDLQTQTGRQRLKKWKSHVESKRDRIHQELDREGKSRTPDQVVAHAMFGFWLDLLQNPFEDPTQQLALWPACERSVFPNDPAMTRAKAEAILASIKHLRNRVSHHEPAWSFGSPAARTLENVLEHMRDKVNEATRLMRAVSQDAEAMLRNAGVLDRLAWLLRAETIVDFSNLAKKDHVNYRQLTRALRKAGREFGADRYQCQPAPQAKLHLTAGGKPFMLLMPYR